MLSGSGFSLLQRGRSWRHTKAMEQLPGKEDPMTGHPLRKYVIIAVILFCNVLPAAAGERFTDNGDGTVTDHQLGLMWSNTDNNGDINWIQAQKWTRYTFPYTLPKTYDNWRLPTLAELKSISVTDKNYAGYETDCGQWVRTIPQIHLSCGWVWTSETDPIAPTARIFNFNNVSSSTTRKAHRRGYRALPVRNIK
jgi:hypothetical protein